MHFCSMNTLLTWHGERNYRGVIPVQGTDPFADEGYTTPEVRLIISSRDAFTNFQSTQDLDFGPNFGPIFGPKFGRYKLGPILAQF